MADAINLLVDYTSPEHPILVEVQDDDGKSVNIGVRKTDEKTGLTLIRITKEDIDRLDCEGDWARHIRATDKIL